MINLSELLWKPQPATGESPTAPIAPGPVKANTGLSFVPVTHLEIPPESRVALITDPRGPGADRFRYFRMRLREIRSAAKVKSLVITSPLPKDGKSTVAMNLATALADKGKHSVVLIEADLHHPTLAQSLGLPARPGLAESLQGNLDPISALTRVEPLSWYLLQAGTTESNPSELLQSDMLSVVVQKLCALFDWVLFDTPPVAPLTDALFLSQHVDASLLVVRAGSTPREAVEEALARLGKKHVLGVVFNGAEGLNRKYSKYYGYYEKK